MFGKSSQSLSQLFLASLKLTKKNWLGLLLIIGFIGVVAIILITVFSVIYYLLLATSLINVSNVVIARAIWIIVSYLATFLITVLAQILLINKLLNSNLKLKANLKQSKSNYFNFFLLNVSITIIFLLCSLPFYAALLLFYLYQPILGTIALIISLIILFFIAPFLIFSPFVLLDKNLNWLVALKQGYKLSRGNYFDIFFKILVYILILIVLECLTLLIDPLFIIGPIINLFIMLILILFTFTYSFSLYQEYKS